MVFLLSTRMVDRGDNLPGAGIQLDHDFSEAVLVGYLDSETGGAIDVPNTYEKFRYALDEAISRKDPLMEFTRQVMVVHQYEKLSLSQVNIFQCIGENNNNGSDHQRGCCIPQISFHDSRAICLFYYCPLFARVITKTVKPDIFLIGD